MPLTAYIYTINIISSICIYVVINMFFVFFSIETRGTKHSQRPCGSTFVCDYCIGL